MARIVNVKYRCCGLNFDAAIDCDWFLHLYELFGDMDRNNVTPIELYCLDNPDWDIHMIFQNNRNEQNCDYAHTVVDWDNIMRETCSWISEMRRRSSEIYNEEKYEV